MDNKDEISSLGQQMSDSTIRLHETIARKAGLSGIDHKSLMLIVRQGPLTAGKLAELTGLTTGAITGLIDRLEKRKLVKRVYDKGDRRKVLIVADDEKVAALLNPIFSQLYTGINDLLTQFTAPETAVIVRYLQGTVAVMDQLTLDLNADN